MACMIVVIIWLVIIIVQAANPMPTGHGNIITFKTCRAHGLIQTCWHPMRMIHGYEAFWLKQPQYNSTVLNIVTHPLVVHLRCGDVLLDYHELYMIPCRSCFSHVNISGPTIMLVGGHGRSPDTDARCGPLAMYYASIMKDLGADVTVRFYGDAKHDWSLLAAAKRAIAISPTSFAFSARVGLLTTFQMFVPPRETQSRASWLHECEMRRAKQYGKTLEHELQSC